MDEVRTYLITLLNRRLSEAVCLLEDAGYSIRSYDEDKGLTVIGDDVDPTMFFEDMDVAYAHGLGNYYVW